jgi:putative PIN family toxin of toxin-antitoxin system
MTPKRRVVVDTSVLISALLLPRSLPRRAVNHALDAGTLLFSEATLRELWAVLGRPKFDAYVAPLEREAFLRTLVESAELVRVTQSLAVCRDPEDDKFLELALEGRADCIVSGDADLLSLHPFGGIAILPPAKFVES